MKKNVLLIAISLLVVMVAGCGNVKEGEKETFTNSAPEDRNESSTDSISEDQPGSSTDTMREVEGETDNATHVEETSEEKITNQQLLKERQTYYQEKFTEVEQSMSEFDYLYKNENSNEMAFAEEQKLNRWDNLLNDVYQDLRSHLSSEEKDALLIQQREWISTRDQTAEENARPFLNTTSYGYELTKSLAELTKQRCYELIEKYSK
ncbi:lysozyme inhibitor LprI family protein [Metabacillus iocasae]|uniref:Uncharacterized protein YecT (DUF1311 family) n=1 Tax=Priestia iocasae TaxID=2291674 RepID=A0ABS2QZ24_9BACI|nr:lysozyme inhibitor LprI family protein [Metabacillus iocasae]MBM7704743.1 uncharacterized protein YecT (DUF1311 family) [Metabacillus iocasae]